MYSTDSSVLSIKSEAFSIRIIRMVQYLNSNGDHTLEPLYKQVLRSGTSIAANIGESQFAQSRADFITKLHIALKETNETKKWLIMLEESNCITHVQATSMKKDCGELIAIITASIKTAKKNSEQQ